MYPYFLSILPLSEILNYDPLMHASHTLASLGLVGVHIDSQFTTCWSSVLLPMLYERIRNRNLATLATEVHLSDGVIRPENLHERTGHGKSSKTILSILSVSSILAVLH